MVPFPLRHLWHLLALAVATISCINLALASGPAAPHTPDRIQVFHAGESNYGGIRIPALLVTKKGTLLAFAEGRRTLADQSGNDIILKRSLDNGTTWTPLQIVHDDGDNSLNNPVPVQDAATGRILLMYQRYPVGLSEFNKGLQPGTTGPSVVKNFLVTSEDDGQTWSTPLDITPSTKREAIVTTLASGPGIGIQITRGAHKGRLIIPFNEGPAKHWNVYAVYSDDGGKTWAMGNIAPGAQVQNSKGETVSRVNEVQMAELSDGSILLNTRDEHRTSDLRKSAVSRDGGHTWSEIKEEPQLTAPPCAGSLFRFDFAEGTSSPGYLLYSGPDSPKSRHHGTIHLSVDDGKNWSSKRLLEPGTFAYSILARLPDGRIGCFYETGTTHAYEQICLARFDLAWITSPAPAP